jgi:hypothetical protein
MERAMTSKVNKIAWCERVLAVAAALTLVGCYDFGSLTRGQARSVPPDASSQLPDPNTFDMATPGDTPDITPDLAPPPQIDLQSSMTYTGSVASAPPAPYGGPPYCSYTMTLSKISATFTIDSAQDVIGSVTDESTEAIKGTCAFPPIPPNLQTYTIKTSTWQGMHVTLTLVAASTNAEKAALVFDGDLSVDRSTISGTLVWRRIDESDTKLDWVVMTNMSLSRMH